MKKILAHFNWWAVMGRFVVGLLFVLFSVPGFFRYMANHWVHFSLLAKPLIAMADFPAFVYSLMTPSPHELFLTSLRLLLYGIGGYLLGLFCLAGCKGRGALNSILGFVGGVLVIHALLWAIQIVIWIVRAVIAIINLVIDLIVYVFHFIGSLLHIVPATTHPPATEVPVPAHPYHPATEVTARPSWFHVGIAFISTHLWLLVLVALLIVLLMILSEGVRNFFAILGAFVAFIVVAYFVFAVILLGLLLAEIVGVGAFLGNIVLDDFIASWESGQGPVESFTGAFGVGMGISMFLLSALGATRAYSLMVQEWSINLPLWQHFSPVKVFYAILPAHFRQVFSIWFFSNTFPIFDVLLLILVIAAAYLGLLRGLWAYKEKEGEFRRFFFSKEANLLLLSPLIALLVPVGLAHLPSEPPSRHIQSSYVQQSQTTHYPTNYYNY